MGKGKKKGRKREGRSLDGQHLCSKSGLQRKTKFSMVSLSKENDYDFSYRRSKTSFSSTEDNIENHKLPATFAERDLGNEIPSCGGHSGSRRLGIDMQNLWCSREETNARNRPGGHLRDLKGVSCKRLKTTTEP